MASKYDWRVSRSTVSALSGERAPLFSVSANVEPFGDGVFSGSTAAAKPIVWFKTQAGAVALAAVLGIFLYWPASHDEGEDLAGEGFGVTMGIASLITNFIVNAYSIYKLTRGLDSRVKEKLWLFPVALFLSLAILSASFYVDYIEDGFHIGKMNAPAKSQEALCLALVSVIANLPQTAFGVLSALVLLVFSEKFARIGRYFSQVGSLLSVDWGAYHKKASFRATDAAYRYVRTVIASTTANLGVSVNASGEALQLMPAGLKGLLLHAVREGLIGQGQDDWALSLAKGFALTLSMISRIGFIGDAYKSGMSMAGGRGLGPQFAMASGTSAFALGLIALLYWRRNTSPRSNFVKQACYSVIAIASLLAVFSIVAMTGAKGLAIALAVGSGVGTVGLALVGFELAFKAKRYFLDSLPAQHYGLKFQVPTSMILLIGAFSGGSAGKLMRDTLPSTWSPGLIFGLQIIADIASGVLTNTAIALAAVFVLTQWYMLARGCTDIQARVVRAEAVEALEKQAGQMSGVEAAKLIKSALIDSTEDAPQADSESVSECLAAGGVSEQDIALVSSDFDNAIPFNDKPAHHWFGFWCGDCLPDDDVAADAASPMNGVIVSAC